MERIPRRVARLILMLGGAGLVVGIALRSRSLLAQLGTVTHPQLGWLTLAVVAEGASLVAYALIVRNLLGFGEVAARMRSLFCATLGGILMIASLSGLSALRVAITPPRPKT